MIIDVSSHNGKLDWNILQRSITGAVIRCGTGEKDDTQFERNYRECKRLKIPVGVYLYSYADNIKEAEAEAARVKRLVKGKTLELPIFYDLEESKKGRVALTCYSAFRAAMAGYRIGIYTGEYYYNTWLKGVSTPYRWIAKYGVNDGRPHSKPKLSDGAKVDMWQYTSNALGGRMDASKVIDEAIFVQTAKTAQKTEKSTTELAQEVLAGSWGNGDERKNRLAAAGYNYTAVQEEVDRLLGSQTKAKKTNTQLAKEVLAGKWGNGITRRLRLTKAGYNYAEIQKLINKLK